MMKYLFALLISVSVFADNLFILGGFAWHERDRSDGTKYEVIIESVGYQYRYEDWSYTALVISDSNNNIMPLATVGWSKNILWNINLGAEAGVGYRDFLRGKRVIPIILPKMEIDFKYVMINITYIPRVETESIHIPQAVYSNIGIRFKKDYSGTSNERGGKATSRIGCRVSRIG